MTQPNAYIAVQDLVDRLGPVTYMAIFDDGNTGSRTVVDASTAVYLVVSSAHAEVTSWLPDIYEILPHEQPSSSAVSFLLKSAELDYAACLSYRRHPEYVRLHGAGPDGPMWKEITAKMERIKSSEQRIAPNDNPPEPTPRNVGGFSVDDSPRLMVDSSDGTSNSGDF